MRRYWIPMFLAALAMIVAPSCTRAPSEGRASSAPASPATRASESRESGLDDVIARYLSGELSRRFIPPGTILLCSTVSPDLQAEFATQLQSWGRDMLLSPGACEKAISAIRQGHNLKTVDFVGSPTEASGILALTVRCEGDTASVNCNFTFGNVGGYGWHLGFVWDGTSWVKAWSQEQIS